MPFLTRLRLIGNYNRCKGYVISGDIYLLKYGVECAVCLAGGSLNPEENSLLATAIRRAKDTGVPKENVESALARVSGLLIQFRGTENVDTVRLSVPKVTDRC